jgi:hypothetical protein
MGDADIAKTYTVSNFGTSGTLTLSAPSISGSGAFAVTTPLSSSVLTPGQTATFTVTYTVHSGARSVDDATVSVASDATDNDPYEFDITATTLNDGVIAVPGDGYTGQYRIAFVTTGTRDATTNVIADYNAFVTAAAAGVTELNVLGATWTCLGSTETIDAKVNTGTLLIADPGYDSANDVPIYTTTGQRIADNNADLWDGTIQNPIFFDNGTVAGVAGGAQEQAWTGTQSDGTAEDGGGGDPTAPLGGITAGAQNVGIARGGYTTNGGWIDGGANANKTGSKHFLALSGALSLPFRGTVIRIR